MMDLSLRFLPHSHQPSFSFDLCRPLSSIKILSQTTLRGCRPTWSGSTGKGKGIKREGSWAKLSPWGRVRSRLVLRQQFKENTMHCGSQYQRPCVLGTCQLGSLRWGQGTKRIPPHFRSQESQLRDYQEGEVPPLCPASGGKTFPPSPTLGPVALTQCEGAAQSWILKRVSGHPSGP